MKYPEIDEHAKNRTQFPETYKNKHEDQKWENTSYGHPRNEYTSPSTFDHRSLLDHKPSRQRSKLKKGDPNWKAGDKNCRFCGQAGHVIGNCTELMPLMKDEIERRLIDKNICTNCMCDSHVFTYCKEPNNCKACGKRHAGLIHGLSKYINQDNAESRNKNLNMQHQKSDPKKRIACHFCGQIGHVLTDCIQLRPLTLEMREQKLIDKNICTNCLSNFHVFLNCKKPNGCKSCHKRHSTFIHGFSLIYLS